MLLIQFGKMQLLLLKLLVNLFLISDYVCYSTTGICEKEDAHDHENTTSNAFYRIRTTYVTIPNCRHSRYCKVKRSYIKLGPGQCLIIPRMNPIVLT